MHVSDILEGLRNKGFFSPLEVEFAVVETNGMISVLPKSFARPATPADLNASIVELGASITELTKRASVALTKGASDPSRIKPADVTFAPSAPSPSAPSLPVALVMEGKLLRDNIINFGTDEKKIAALLKTQRVNLRDVMLLTVDRENTVYLQAYRENFRTFTAKELTEK
jgi:uncharacterized membrane protein YcaP (DUF421 family)